MVQSLKAIFHRTEAEIYATLVDCNFDPDLAFDRLLMEAEDKGASSGVTDFADFPISSDYYPKNFDEIERIGSGASGHVYRYTNKVDGCTYAIKKIEFISKDYDTIKREVRLMSRLSHPNIIRYYQCWIEEGVDPHYSSGSRSVDTSTAEENPENASNQFISLED